MVAELGAATIIGVVGWVAAPTFTRLINKAWSYLVKKYKWHTGHTDKLQELADLLSEISCTVSLVEEAGRIPNYNMVCWLSQLKDAIDEVVNIFDILDCDIIGKSNQLVDQAADSSAGSIGSFESLEMLEKLLKKLKEIRKSSRGLVQASMLAVTVAAGSSDGSTSRPAVTGPLLPMEALGYDDEYERLMKCLVPVDGCNSGTDVVAIIGHGGMGKTTLAQQAWSDSRLKAKFGLTIWASVRNKFSEADLIGEIWRSAARALLVVDDGPWHGEMSFGNMQQALEYLVVELSEKKKKPYLLVLDDVCNDEMATDLQKREVWSHVLAPFWQRGMHESRILMTTRAIICAQTLGADRDRRITLDGLDRDSFIKLLKRNLASGSKDLINDESLRSSTLISKPKGSSWKGSPLLAKEIGLKLSSTRRENWAEILETDCHETVIAAHVPSYQQLPQHLQHCLAFLSLFPNKFEFQSEMLVKLWVAHGFITGNDRGAMEETARQYLNDLAQKSFLQSTEEGKTEYYVMHGQIHSMIRSVSANYFMMIQGNHATTKIPPTVRHLSVTTICLPQLKNLIMLKKLRTLIVLGDSSAVCTAIDKDLLSALNGIRFMDLTETDITDLPPEIGNLLHLRYLALPNTIQVLPKEISKLYHVQILVGSNYAQKDEESYLMNFDSGFKCHGSKKSSFEQLGDSLCTPLIANTEHAQEGQLNNKKSVKVMKRSLKRIGGARTPLLKRRTERILQCLRPKNTTSKYHLLPREQGR